MTLNCVCAYGSSPATRALVKPVLFGQLPAFLGGWKAMRLIHPEKCTCGPCVQLRAAACADLPQLLEASDAAEHKVILVRSQTQGLQVGVTSEELPDLSLTVGYSSITLRWICWNTVSMTSLCSQTTWNTKQSPLWLLLLLPLLSHDARSRAHTVSCSVLVQYHYG